MPMWQRINQFLAGVEWRWSLFALISAALGSFVIPAWAVRTAQLFSEYAPASWIFGGFAGLLFAGISFALFAWGRVKWVRANIDSLMSGKGAWVDPLAKSYEDRRIYLGALCLPSFPLLENKTFINCEIIGPANIVPEYGNNIQEPRYPICDAVLLRQDHKLFNAVILRNCTFRNCSFQQITFLVPFTERQTMGNWDFLNKISEGDTNIQPITQQNDLPVLPPTTPTTTVEVRKRPRKSRDRI